MAEENEEQQKAPEVKKSKTGLYLAIIVVQLLIAGFLVWKFVFPEYTELKTANDVALGKYEKPKEDAKDEKADGEPKELGTMYKIENLTVNPSGSRGMRFAVVGFSLEVPGGEEDVAVLDKYKTVIMDRYLAYFRKRSIKDLAKESLTDSLKKDIINLTNETIGREVVDNVYFSQYVLQ